MRGTAEGGTSRRGRRGKRAMRACDAACVWPRRPPAAPILLWQALGLAGGLAAVGALLAIRSQAARHAGLGVLAV